MGYVTTPTGEWVDDDSLDMQGLSGLGDLQEDSATLIDSTTGALHNPATGLDVLMSPGLSRIDVGDSTVETGGSTDATSIVYSSGYSYGVGATLHNITDNSFFEYGNIMLGAPTTLLVNAGVGANTTDQVLARLTADVLSHSPKLINIAVGTNDIIADKSADYVINNLTSIFDACQSIGAHIVYTDILPRSVFTSSQLIEAVKVNQWAAEEQLRRQRYRHVAVFGLLADPLTGAPLSGVTWDGTHQNNVGAFIIGREYARTLSGWLPAWNYVPMGAAESYLTNTNAIVRNDNPLMAAGSGGTAGTGVTGTIAQGFDCARAGSTPSAVGSIEAHPNGFGYRQKLVITFTAGAQQLYFGTPTITSRWVNGAMLEGQCDLTVEAGSAEVLSRITLSCAGTVSGPTRGARCMDQLAVRAPGNIPYGANGFSGRFRTLRALTPATGTCTTWNNRLNLYSGAAGTVTVYISMFAIRMIPLPA